MTGWKETVINPKQADMIQRCNCGGEFVILYDKIREEQAEISFKAGYEQGWGRAVMENLKAFRAGIREVEKLADKAFCGLDPEDVDIMDTSHLIKGIQSFLIGLAKLKDRGINREEQL